MATEYKLSDLLSKVISKTGKSFYRPHLEINLVPDIKGEMIKTLKLRNYIFFLCIVVVVASVGLTTIFGVIAGGQQLAINSKQQTISKLSEKLNSYSDLNDFLTIKDQLGNISTLSENKNVVSRTFNILSAMLPKGADTITVSELGVNLSEEQPTLTLEAQANAGSDPFIDYNVLDSFKKSMQFMRYDYGHYVDKKGETIPAYCMIESGDDGATLSDSSKGLYAYWTIKKEGCNPSKAKDSEYSLEDLDGEQVVRIWRTPQYSDWYQESASSSGPQMSLDGTISNVAHFESSCITYHGDDSKNSANPKWTTENQCTLVRDDSEQTEGITILESSNGRDASNELVLRFSATIYIDPGAYQFKNTHMLAIAPSGRINVTDSYVQVQAMFGQRAADCEDGDTDCSTNTRNTNGTNNSDQNVTENTDQETNQETGGDNG